MKGYTMSVHQRKSPNGTSRKVILPAGLEVADLQYKQQLPIWVDGEEKSAVVDLMVASFWGGPRRAFDVYDRSGNLQHVYLKLVWMEDSGDWNESRDVREATEEEFLAWRAEFEGNEPPTPMP
jgi:hypothetical protein